MPYKKYSRLQKVINKKYSRWCDWTAAGIAITEEVATVIAAAAAVGGTVAAISASQEAATARENQFDEQKVQLRLKQTQAQARRTEQLRRIFGEQAAEEVARGISLASPTFKAVQQQSFNAFNDDNRAESLSLSFKENALNSAISSTRSVANIESFALAAKGIGQIAGTMDLNNPNNINRGQVFQTGGSSGLTVNELKNAGGLASFPV